MMEHDECVLVTGGSGFIAGYCIAQALNEGWRVRTTVRNLSREATLRADIAKLAPVGDRLEVVAADLDNDHGWKEAARDCVYVLHVASPFPATVPKDDDELVCSARDGALRLLTAARDAGVKRVVMTSSVAAIAYGRGGRNSPFDETDWSDATNKADSSAYERSKTIAERAAWDWVAREGGALELTTICPGAVLGPMLGANRSASIDIVSRLLDGSLPGVARFGWAMADVRDVADLHLKAMTSPKAAGQRYIAAGDFVWMSDIADVLRKCTPNLAKRVPRRALPDMVVRLSALFDSALRARIYELNKRRPVTAAKARRDLSWSPRSNAEMIEATAESLGKGGNQVVNASAYW